MNAGHHPEPAGPNWLLARQMGGIKRRDSHVRPSSPAPERDDAGLAGWLIASLLGVVLGFGLAKYSQAWAQETFHPGAAWGTLVILTSLTLTVVAGYQYAARSAGFRAARRASPVLVSLSMLLVFALSWAALSIIWFAGWELLPDRPR